MKIKIEDSIDLPSRLILISLWVDVTGDDDDLQKMGHVYPLWPSARWEKSPFRDSKDDPIIPVFPTKQVSD